MSRRSYSRLVALLAPLLFCTACDSESGSGTAAPGETGKASGRPEKPPADAFEVTILNHCADPWRYYVALAEGHGADGRTGVVPPEEYTQLPPGASQTQTLQPGDVVWMVNKKGESTATGFHSKAEGTGGRIEVRETCDGVKRVRIQQASDAMATQ